MSKGLEETHLRQIPFRLIDLPLSAFESSSALRQSELSGK
jgi:hypothetical protein